MVSTHDTGASESGGKSAWQFDLYGQIYILYTVAVAPSDLKVRDIDAKLERTNLSDKVYKSWTSYRTDETCQQQQEASNNNNNNRK